MKNIYELMRQKEAEFERLKSELQALRIAAPLLEEELTEDVRPVPIQRPVQAKPVAAPTDAKAIWP